MYKSSYNNYTGKKAKCTVTCICHPCKVSVHVCKHLKGTVKRENLVEGKKTIISF